MIGFQSRGRPRVAVSCGRRSSGRCNMRHGTALGCYSMWSFINLLRLNYQSFAMEYHCFLDFAIHFYDFRNWIATSKDFHHYDLHLDWQRTLSCVSVSCVRALEGISNIHSHIRPMESYYCPYLTSPIWMSALIVTCKLLFSTSVP